MPDGNYGSVSSERDPNGLSAKDLGSKLDDGKAPVRRGLLEYFPRACLAVAEVSAAGANKYTWNGWEFVDDGVNRYGDAQIRHICKAAIEGAVDPGFGLLHASHEAWNALARLELLLREREGVPAHQPQKEQRNGRPGRRADNLGPTTAPDHWADWPRAVRIPIEPAPDSDYAAKPINIAWGDPGDAMES